MQNAIKGKLFSDVYNKLINVKPSKAIDMLKQDAIRKKKDNQGLIDEGLSMNLEIQEYEKKRQELREKTEQAVSDR